MNGLLTILKKCLIDIFKSQTCYYDWEWRSAQQQLPLWWCWTVFNHLKWNETDYNFEVEFTDENEQRKIAKIETMIDEEELVTFKVFVDGEYKCEICIKEDEPVWMDIETGEVTPFTQTIGKAIERHDL